MFSIYSPHEVQWGKSFKSAHQSLLIPFSSQHSVNGGSEIGERHKRSEGEKGKWYSYSFV